MKRDDAADKDLYEILRDLEFLRGVKDEHVRKLADKGRLVAFSKGEMVFREQEPALHCHLVVDGLISLEICAPVAGCATVLTIGRGELLGWSPLVGRDRLTANARVLADTTMVEIDASDVLQLCEQEPEFGYRFMRCAALALAKRLTATRLQLLDLYHRDSPKPGIATGNRP
jgi:CRP-like cAMP-binding protein